MLTQAVSAVGGAALLASVLYGGKAVRSRLTPKRRRRKRR